MLAPLKNYFTSIAETTKRSMNYAHENFSDNVSYESGITIFLQDTDKEEITNITSSLKSSKDSGPIGILYRILFWVFFHLYSQLQR